MARTFRNKNTIAVGWTVRDDGIAYRGAQPSTWADHPAPYRRSIYRCEGPDARRQWSVTYRAYMNHMVRIGRWEDILRPTRTSGWDTW